MSSSPTEDLITSILIRLNECSVAPNVLDQNYNVKLAFALTGLERSDLFSPFFPFHRLIASKLIDYLISIENLNEFEMVARYGRERINPSLFSYAFAVAVLNRTDMKNVSLKLPSPAEIFPDKFFPASTILNAITELNSVPESERVSYVVIIKVNLLIFQSSGRIQSVQIDRLFCSNQSLWKLQQTTVIQKLVWNTFAMILV